MSTKASLKSMSFARFFFFVSVTLRRICQTERAGKLTLFQFVPPYAHAVPAIITCQQSAIISEFTMGKRSNLGYNLPISIENIRIPFV